VEPNELPADLLRDPEVTAALCPHLHLPLQSGAPRLLAAMGRPYRADRFRAVVEDAAAALPGACLGTDLLVGFPGEREEDHRATVALVETLPLAYLHVFPFSPRPGTPAAALPEHVPAHVVRARTDELLALSDRRWRAYLAAQVGRELEVVVERSAAGVARGTAREWVTVRWPSAGEARGTVVRVRVQGSDGTACLGARA
jgi:threonylcarbamoyladenosine tRNA methylthiotransferase MtaB